MKLPFPPTPPCAMGSGKGPAEYKAAGLVYVRRAIQAVDGGWQRACAVLTAEEQRAFEDLLATDWVGLQLASRIYLAAGAALSPDDPLAGMRRAGHIVGIETLRGPYAIVFKVLTVSFAVGSAARFWGLYNRRGRVEVLEQHDRRVAFHVVDHADMPEELREAISGWLVALFELCGITTVTVTKSGNAAGWRWSATW